MDWQTNVVALMGLAGSMAFLSLLVKLTLQLLQERRDRIQGLEDKIDAARKELASCLERHAAGEEEIGLLKAKIVRLEDVAEELRVKLEESR